MKREIDTPVPETRKPTTGRRLARKMAAAAVLVSALIALTSAPASAEYAFYQRDDIDVWTSNGAVHASGYVNWFRDWRWVPPGYVVRGEYHGAAKLHREGCMYMKIEWTFESGSVSTSPSISTYSVGDGYYRKCGSAGTTASFGGVANSGGTLLRTCVTLAYSSNSKGMPSYQGRNCMYKF